jgi:hypothetical protein
VDWREWRARALAPVDEDRAWTCLTVNLAGLPGLGTAMAGRFVEGGLQAALALAGALVCLRWILLFLGEWSRRGEYPWGGGEHLALGVAGIALFAAGWLWALGSSVSFLRAARRRKESAPGQARPLRNSRSRSGTGAAES